MIDPNDMQVWMIAIGFLVAAVGFAIGYVGLGGRRK